MLIKKEELFIIIREHKCYCTRDIWLRWRDKYRPDYRPNYIEHHLSAIKKMIAANKRNWRKDGWRILAKNSSMDYAYVIVPTTEESLFQMSKDEIRETAKAGRWAHLSRSYWENTHMLEEAEILLALCERDPDQMIELKRIVAHYASTRYTIEDMMERIRRKAS